MAKVSLPINKADFFKDAFLKSVLVAVGIRGLSELGFYLLKDGYESFDILNLFSGETFIHLGIRINNDYKIALFRITEIPKSNRKVGAAAMDYEYKFCGYDEDYDGE